MHILVQYEFIDYLFCFLLDVIVIGSIFVLPVHFHVDYLVCKLITQREIHIVASRFKCFGYFSKITIVNLLPRLIVKKESISVQYALSLETYFVLELTIVHTSSTPFGDSRRFCCCYIFI